MRYLKYILAGLLALIPIVLYILSLGRGPKPDLSTFQKKKKVIDAEAEAKKLKKQLGHEKAKREVEKRYEKQLQELNEEERQEVASLQDDPVRLARLLAGKED